MKKILFLLVILMCALGTYAQNKVCSECGIVKYNVTYPWQHHTWCPYYRPQSSGSSSNSSTVNYGAYTVAYTVLEGKKEGIEKEKPNRFITDLNEILGIVNEKHYFTYNLK